VSDTAAAERPWVMWVAHQEPWVVGVALLAGLLSVTWGGLLFGLAGVVTFVAALATIWLSRSHDSALCPRCASAIPIDPGVAVVQHRWALWLHHRRRRLLMLGMLSWVLLVLPVGAELPIIVGYGPVIIVSYVDLRHRPLVRWCPECHWGHGGGDSEDVPAPDPQPASKRHPS
jgi:hypothetical protein